jgi:Mg-chelatase subunit ChlD
MQDWAASGGGVYVYPSTAGEMDRAFERMATWLRRPAAYTLTYSTSSVVLDPGLLSVRAPADASRPAMAPGVGVELILDTSGSMLERLEGRTRIEIAKEALQAVVRDGLDEGVPVALRTFGRKGKGRKANCATQLTLPLQPLEKADTAGRIGRLTARKGTRTPIGAALLAVADDLATIDGPRTVVLVTDGEETCKGDPVAAIETLRAAGLDVHVNIVGFALDDETLKATMAEWAAGGGGTYFDASGAEALAEAISAAVSAPFVVYGPDGTVFASGTVGGGPARLDPGTYRVEVLVDPPVTFSDVVVGGGETVALDLPAPGEER